MQILIIGIGYKNSILVDHYTSPIEHVWDALDRRIRQRVPVPANIQQLRTAIEEEWTNIPQATINNLINSMRRRCVALREANGGHTRYWLVFWLQKNNINKHKYIINATQAQ